FREDDKRNGISWSLSRRVAEGFAHDATVFVVKEGEKPRRNARLGVLNGREFYGNAYTREEWACLPARLIVGQCDLQDALAYTNIRQEQEIIIDPAKVSNIVELTPTAKHIVLPTEGFQVGAEPLDWLLSTRQH
ncbi:MAG: hypothetical protein ABI318_14100, partial [Chthoniobacteraceae bacterium]